MDERIRVIPKFVCPVGHEHDSERDADLCCSLQNDLVTVSQAYMELKARVEANAPHLLEPPAPAEEPKAITHQNAAPKPVRRKPSRKSKRG